MTTVLVPIGLTSVLLNDTLHTKEANMTMVQEPEMLRPTSPAIASAMRVPSVDAEEDSAESNSSGSSSDEEEAAPTFEVSLDEDVDGSFSPRSPRRSSEPPMPAEFSITHSKLEETLSGRKTGGHWSESSSAHEDGAVKLPLSARSSRSPSVALRHEAALRSFNIRRLVSNTTPSTAEPSSAPATVADLKGYSEDGSEEGENDRDVRAYLDTVEQRGTAVFGEIEKEDEDEDAKFLPPRIEIEQDWNSDDDDEDVDTHPTPASNAQQDASQRVRKQASIRMLNTLGRTPPTNLATATPSTATSTSSSGSQTLPKPVGLAARRSHHRLPSLDQIGSRSSVAKVGTPLPFNKTPMPQTPGTASLHQRAVSCPTNGIGSMSRKKYGSVQVFITPPTPRPAGSGPAAVPNVVLARSSGNILLSPRSPHKSAVDALLTPPPFELAPGRKRMEEEQAKAAALQMWQMWQAQAASIAAASASEQHAMAYQAATNPWMRQVQQWAAAVTGSPSMSAIGSPGLHSPGTPALKVEAGSTPSLPLPRHPRKSSHTRSSQQSSPSSFLPSVNSTPSSASSSSISIGSGAHSSKAQSASATSTNWRRVPSAMLESGSHSTASTSSRRYVPPHLRGSQDELVAGFSAPASRANFGAESVEQAVRAQPRDAVSDSVSSESGPVKAANGARAAARTSMLAKLGQRSASPAPASSSAS
ncbi:hypothetical protein IE81DRAFT_166818 [Ceraceosorus guamensis]|uniref:Uncharacterized protein n=1 Tax=Ceraceosorus guamensis TaxID=1522189 RepID=A0A316WCY2_9BASI|nr:hypothetical protein IE81DRAFT_166818 [Ceraceosorus guamensis]PWN45713.1 hypothetical protein IE81DRAFT_166818 [Ceraceosorus guamensis]